MTQKRHSEAWIELRRAYDIRKLAPAHRDTATIYRNLAAVLGQLDKNDEATKLFLRAIEIRTDTLGLAHFLTIITRDNFGLFALRARQPLAALAQYRAIDLAIRERLGTFDNEEPRKVEQFHAKPIFASYVQATWRAAHD